MQSGNELAIWNLKNKLVDFKVRFVERMNAAFTCSNGIVCIPRLANGCLLKFGQDPAGCMKNHLTKGVEDKFFPSLNCLRNKFELSYGNSFYLEIDEAIVNWSAYSKKLPISACYHDYLVRD